MGLYRPVTSRPVPRAPLISAFELEALLGQAGLLVVDCRFSLKDPDEGRRSYQLAHIPGALYAHLNQDLSGPVVPGQTGRHPLPEAETLAEKLSAWGIDKDTYVVAYDQADGSMAAARLWWLLRYLGHERVSVLDGGMNAWLAAGYSTRSGDEKSTVRASFVPRPRPEMLATPGEVREMSRSRQKGLLDARAFARFTGEVEPIDARAGHIPGATSLPFSSMLDGGKFRTQSELRGGFEAALGGDSSESLPAVAYCGSGVTACHLVLAAEAAGRSDLRLYAGSFSEWIVDPEAPVETGPA